jgi:hypothetical protein
MNIEQLSNNVKRKSKNSLTFLKFVGTAQGAKRGSDTNSEITNASSLRKVVDKSCVWYTGSVGVLPTSVG